MTARDPLFVVGAAGAGQTTPTEARLALAGLVAAGAGGAAARSGVLHGPGAPLAVSGTAGMSYSVAAGQAVTDRGSAALGSYLGSNDGAATVSTTAAPWTVGTSRYDAVYIRFPDVEQGDANSAAVLGVTQGTAAASPTVPAVPTGALILATALVPQGTTRTDTGVTITQVAPWTVARGGLVPVRSQTERDAMTGYDGLTVTRLDANRLEQHDGTNWAVLADTADRTAWTAYTPTLTNITGGLTGTASYAYKLVGKTLFLRGQVPTSGCTATALGIVKISLPSGLTIPTTQAISCVQTRTTMSAIVNATGGHVIEISSATGGDFAAGAALTNLRWTGVLEVN